MRQLLEQQRAQGFPAFAGTMIRGRLPLKESLLNEVIADAVARRGGAVKDARIAVLADNRIVINVAAMIGPFRKNVAVTLDIEPLIDLAVSPRFVLRIVRTEGLFGFSLETIIGLLKPLPGIVIVSGQTIAVDLKAAATTTGDSDLLFLVRQVGFATMPGTLFVDFHIQVDTTP